MTDDELAQKAFTQGFWDGLQKGFVAGVFSTCIGVMITMLLLHLFRRYGLFCVLLCAGVYAESATATLLIIEKGAITQYATVTQVDGGKLVTCWHAIKDGGTIKLGSSRGWVECTVDHFDEFLDLAVLKPAKKVKLSPLTDDGIIAAPGGNLAIFDEAPFFQSIGSEKSYRIGARKECLIHGISGGCVIRKGKLVGIIRGLVHGNTIIGNENPYAGVEFVPAANVRDFLKR